MIHQNRRKELLSKLDDNAVVIVSTNSEQKRNSDVNYPFRPDSNFWYLTGFIEPDAIAVFSKNNYTIFLKPKDVTKEIWNGLRLGVEMAPKTLLANNAYDIDTFLDKIESLLTSESSLYFDAPGNIGWKDVSSTNKLNQSIALKFRNRTQLLDPYLSEMRLIKDSTEIQHMQTAADLASKAHMQAMIRTRPGLYEYHITAEFDTLFRKEDSEHSYPPIVAGGENACILHYNENNKLLNDGELLLIDAGCEILGYASDITRTFPINGKFSEPQKEIYEIVLKAQKSAIASIVPGEAVNKPHEIACDVITQELIKLGIMDDASSLRDFYMHGTGHWLGLDVHDVGTKEIDNTIRKFKVGMVTTVEPGIYIRKSDKVDPKYWNIGIRIEDDVLVTEDGHHILSKAAIKELEDIEQLMSQ